VADPEFDGVVGGDPGGGAGTEISRAESRLEEAASRAGLAEGGRADRPAEAPPAAEKTTPEPAPRESWEEDRWAKTNDDWRTNPNLSWRQRRERGRQQAAEREAQKLFEKKLDDLGKKIEGIGATGRGGAEEEPDFDLDQKAWWEKQVAGLKSSFEEQLAPLREAKVEHEERLQREAESREREEQFGEWAAERAEWVREAERVYVGGDERRAGEYNFYKGVIADTCYQQGRMLYGDSPKAQAFARSSMLAMTDLAEQTGTNPAALVEMLGRQQMMTALQWAHRLGIVQPVEAVAAAPRPAATRVQEQREFITSAEAGGAAPPPAARTNGKAPRDGNFLSFMTKALSEKGQREGMKAVVREGVTRYGSDWPKVQRELLGQIRNLGRRSA
jgi:hypothetical protein